MTDKKKKEEKILKEEVDKTEINTENPEEVTTEVEDKSTEKAEDAEDINGKYLRLMADFQNYRRRTEKEKADIYAYANEKLVGDLLDVIDNFERALEQTEEVQPRGFVTGMEMISKQLKEVLEKSGLEGIKALGEAFDPNFHNAMMTEETEEYEEGQVSAVLQKGYMLNKKVIRPTMVKVAK